MKKSSCGRKWSHSLKFYWTILFSKGWVRISCSHLGIISLLEVRISNLITWLVFIQFIHKAEADISPTIKFLPRCNWHIENTTSSLFSQNENHFTMEKINSRHIDKILNSMHMNWILPHYLESRHYQFYFHPELLLMIVWN